MRLARLPLLPVVLTAVVICVTALSAQDQPLRPSADERPLPDQAAFLAEARARLATDSSLQSSYIYTETRREQKLDRRGRVTHESVKVFYSYPGLPGEERWEQLISEDGKRRPASELEREMRDRQKKAEAIVRASTQQPERERARQQREYDEARRRFDAIVDDVFRVFDIRMERRELINGHETIAFTLTPRPGAKPRTSEGGQMLKFKVRAWLSESEKELVRMDAEALDTVSFGFGILARLHKGAKLTFDRTKVNDEVWLPARASYSGSARVGLIAVFRRAGSSEFSGYRKFSVNTSTTYQSATP
jgi:hypothetical protein